MKRKPTDKGFKMPPEWHPHAATQLHWPTNRETWPGERLDRVEKVYLRIIGVLHRYEPIHLFVGDEKVRDYVLVKFEERGINSQQVTFHLQPINDVWARDCGPIFIRKEDNSEEFAVTDWEYNAWGGKYPPYEDDNKIPAYLADMYGIERYEPGMVLEGGSIEINGNGVLLTTESVLLNENRNPGLSREEIEEKLKSYLGIEEIIWLKRGLAGDDTDGHIDDLARFLNESTILAVTVDDPEDVNYQALQENLEILQQATDRHGQSFTIETLPLPQTRIEGTTVDGSEYVPASYANFYIANGVVLVPTYDLRFDEQALGLFKEYFPEREVVGIPCADLVWGQGSIHCITQQLYGI
ncbi:agmatine deiminase family protein [Aliifodinibius sp. S!AR15-10]|uniref:agmatine deiminase family protein n=1 Tax=Aliifodinibius sp. S!AR15-10 TaxID=2950437 RepID=UPI0028627689|nr:agmatine deiminase family protein [Aliifodinibius sp. S!AR15-10]MDR8391098.1 agmatine deiminase family protein [Aliifodinibius sp. S!AR15-10]